MGDCICVVMKWGTAITLHYLHNIKENDLCLVSDAQTIAMMYQDNLR